MKILGPQFTIFADDGATALAALSLPEDPALLDVGTGSGSFAIYLASQGYHVLTGEPADDQTQYARQAWSKNAQKAGVADKIRFASFDAADIPFPTGLFDAVFFFGVLHHVAEVSRPAVLKEALRVSKTAGAVVFFEPRPDMLKAVRLKDAAHPPAADPATYLPSDDILVEQIEGRKMDITILRHPKA